MQDQNQIRTGHYGSANSDASLSTSRKTKKQKTNGTVLQVSRRLSTFINVYKHYGSIPGTSSSGSKIQDSRKNFLDPGSKILETTSWIQAPRFWKKFLGSKVWIQDPRLQKKLLGSEDNAFPDPRLGSAVDPRSFFCNLGSWILGPDLGSKKKDAGKNWRNCFLRRSCGVYLV